MAHKKGVGSSKNGRESHSKRLGVKIGGGQKIIAMNTEQQIPLNLPSASTSTAKSIEPITITLTTTHTLYIDNQEISSDRLAQEVKSIVTQAPQQAFVIRASKDVYYNDVIELLDMLKVNGAKYISVATERK